MPEAELLEKADGGLAVHERVELDLEVALLLAEPQGGLHQGGADAPAALVGADAQSADLAAVFLVRLHADHPDDVPAGRLGDPEVIARRLYVRPLDVVDVGPRVVLRQLPGEQPLLVQLAARRQVRRAELADAEWGFGRAGHGSPAL